ncbi:MAG: hypothetical protein KF901_15210 [Myxococcales bacterium]|nr:hypothetical protein [Myxococcales bacterium]
MTGGPPPVLPTSRRDDLTFRGNVSRGRHGWLRLTPAYSVRIVEALLDRFEGARVFDPFGGSATTPLCAAERGLDAVATELNPFLVWLGRAKLRRHDVRTLRAAEALGTRVAATRGAPTPPPPIHRIERWWSPSALDALCRLKAALDRAPAGAARDLVTVAFCRSVVALSGARFDHVSMSFGDAPDHDERAVRARFAEDLAHVLDGATARPRASATLRRDDARALRTLGDARFDLVITSPPYPNRISYVRELRPYMYWTGHLREAREAGELDWKAIGGTWGVATSRLDRWRPSAPVATPLAAILPRVFAAHPKNGPLLTRYLERYFEDLDTHLRALRPHVREGGRVAYVVGNSSFYGELVPVESLYAEALERAGFRRATVEVLRKRNSNRALYEYLVLAEG